MRPASVDLAKAARFVQLFKINAFTATKEEPGYTASMVCAVGGHDWRIEFHPKSSKPGGDSSDDWIMFRVRLISKGASGVAASFSCQLVYPTSTSGGLGLEEMVTSSLFYENKSMDVFLVTRSYLENCRSRLVKDDCILVQCAINVLQTKDAAAGAASDAVASPSVPSSDLHQYFGELLRSQKGAVITFIVAGESVAAHRSVLAARSPVFMAELFGFEDVKEKASPCIEIKDMEVEVFRAMLHFVYTGTVPELDQEGEQAKLMAQRLLEAADWYGLQRLKMICVEKMCTDISDDTVATTLALAEQHGCSELKSRCMNFILDTPENFHAIAATEGYKHLEASCPSVLTELVKLMVKGTKRPFICLSV